MKLVIDIPETEYQMFIVACNHGIGNTAMERILDGKSLNDMLQEIRQDIANMSRFSGDSYFMAKQDACDVIDKYIKEIKDEDKRATT